MEELFGGVSPATKAKLQEMAAASTSRAKAAADQTRPAANLSHADLDDGSDSGEKAAAPFFEAKETTKALESGFKVSLFSSKPSSQLCLPRLGQSKYFAYI